MTGSGQQNFASNDLGEHDWIDQRFETSNHQQFTRSRSGWPTDRQVVTVLTGRAMDDSPYVSLDSQFVHKTVEHYGTGRGIAFHNRDDYLKFMYNIIEAGVRAGFITEDEGYLMEPPREF